MAETSVLFGWMTNRVSVPVMSKLALSGTMCRTGGSVALTKNLMSPRGNFVHNYTKEKLLFGNVSFKHAGMKNSMLGLVGRRIVI